MRFSISMDRESGFKRTWKQMCLLSSWSEKTDGFTEKVERAHQKKKTILLFKIMETFFTNCFWKNQQASLSLDWGTEYISIKAQEIDLIKLFRAKIKTTRRHIVSGHYTFVLFSVPSSNYISHLKTVFLKVS